VITCAYNAEAWIAQTLQSIFAQTYTSYEVIVVDDGSTDRTADIVRRFEGCVLISQPNRGLGAARNAGIAGSRGELIAQLDADDLWFPTALAALVPAFDDPAVGVACADVLIWDEKTPWDRCPRYWQYYRPPAGDAAAWPQLIQENFVPTVTSVIRRSLLDRIGVFDERLSGFDDYDMWLRATLAGAKIRCVEQVLGVYRIRGGSLSANLGAKLDATLRIYEKMLSTGNLTAQQRRLVLAAMRRTKTGYRTAGVNYLLAGQVSKARRYLWRAFAFAPYDPRSVLALGFASVSPRSAANWAAAIRKWRSRP
jgi:glycosyltransferase involved in cell wall biosynthesis